MVESGIEPARFLPSGADKLVVPHRGIGPMAFGSKLGQNWSQRVLMSKIYPLHLFDKSGSKPL